MTLEMSLTSNSIEGPTISPSRISTYRKCPKLYHYSYVLKLEPKHQGTRNFDKGLYFHELCHVYYRYVQNGVEIGSATAVKLMTDRIKRDLQQGFTIERAQLFATISKQFVGYIQLQSPKIDKGIKVLGVEEEIKVPVTLPSGRIIFLHGFLDLRYIDSEGQHVVRDHKTDSSGGNPDRNIWSWGGAGLSPQLLFYALAKWVETDHVHDTEINWINTKDYSSREPALERRFHLYRDVHPYNEMEASLAITLQLIDEMLDSNPTPHYDEQVCKYCAFKTPCIGERRGLDSERILATNYVIKTKAHGRDTSNNNTTDDETSIIGDD